MPSSSSYSPPPYDTSFAFNDTLLQEQQYNDVEEPEDAGKDPMEKIRHAFFESMCVSVVSLLLSPVVGATRIVLEDVLFESKKLVGLKLERSFMLKIVISGIF